MALSRAALRGLNICTRGTRCFASQAKALAVTQATASPEGKALVDEQHSIPQIQVEDVRHWDLFGKEDADKVRDFVHSKLDSDELVERQQAERITEVFGKFEAQDEYFAKMNAASEIGPVSDIPSIDWNSWRSRIKMPGVVDRLQNIYEARVFRPDMPHHEHYLSEKGIEEWCKENNATREDFDKFLTSSTAAVENDPAKWPKWKKEWDQKIIKGQADQREYLHQLYLDREQLEAYVDGLDLRTSWMSLAEHPEIAEAFEEGLHNGVEDGGSTQLWYCAEFQTLDREGWFEWQEKYWKLPPYNDVERNNTMGVTKLE